jgi:nucleoside-triphosphatase THEP1
VIVFMRKSASPVILFVGPVGGGKTSTLTSLVSKWRASGKEVRGLLAHRVMEKGHRVGYDLEVIGKERRSALARKEGAGIEQIGPFVFLDDALARGRKALRAATSAQIVIVDEIGPLELSGRGWSREVERLLHKSKVTLILVARESLQEQLTKWLQSFDRVVHSLHTWETAKLDSLL